MLFNLRKPKKGEQVPPEIQSKDEKMEQSPHFFLPAVIQEHACSLDGRRRCRTSGMVDEGQQAATATTEEEEEAHHAATLRWRDGGDGWREREGRCGGLLYHLGAGGHVVVFQGIDGAHYTVLTVVGGGLGRECRHSK